MELPELSMDDYLEETKYAVTGLLDLIYKEEFKLQKVFEELLKVEGELSSIESLYDRFLGMEYDLEGVSDSQTQHNYIQWYKHKQRTPEIEKRKETLENEKQKLELLIETNESSTRVLCGALLQIAKQGISIVYGILDNCSNLKPTQVKSVEEPLKNFIWYGRNQSLHFEEGRITNNAGRIFFEKIIAAYDVKFSKLKSMNYAKEIIEILGWSDYKSYEKDMLLLCP